MPDSQFQLILSKSYANNHECTNTLLLIDIFLPWNAHENICRILYGLRQTEMAVFDV